MLKHKNTSNSPGGKRLNASGNYSSNVSGASSPMKKTSHKSPSKGKEEEEKGLTSPTSVSMYNSFIIKNADESFD